MAVKDSSLRRPDRRAWGPSAPHVLSRRTALTGAGALVGGAILGVPAVRAQASTAVHRFKLGAADITVVSDGNMSLPLSFMLPGRERADVEAVFKSEGRTLGEFVNPVNVMLVRIGAELILIDTDMLATDKTALLGYHLPWPGLGRVERKDAAFRFIAG